MNVTQLPHCIESCQRRTVRGQLIQGHSVSTERTGFYHFNLGIHLDAGMGCYFTVHRIFLTHCHCDHMQHLPMLLHSNRGIAKVYCPSEDKEGLRVMLDSFYRATRTPYPFELIGVDPGYTETFSYKGKSYTVTVHNCKHMVPCRCYSFEEHRMKLKSQYACLPKQELAKLSKQGVELSEAVAVPVFAYICDTALEAVTDQLLQHQVVMIECTFWHDTFHKRAKQKGHIYFQELLPVIEKYNATAFVLFHVSKRHTWHEVQQLCACLPNVTVWTDHQ